MLSCTTEEGRDGALTAEEGAFREGAASGFPDGTDGAGRDPSPFTNTGASPGTPVSDGRSDGIDPFILQVLQNLESED